MEEPLPPGWRAVWSKTYETEYWFHAERRESSWLRPYLDTSGREAFAEPDDVNGDGPITQEVPSPEPALSSDSGSRLYYAESPQRAPPARGAVGAGMQSFDGFGISVDGGGVGNSSSKSADLAALTAALADAREEEASVLVELSNLKQKLRAIVRERERLALALASAQAQQASNHPAHGNHDLSFQVRIIGDY